MFLLGIHSVIIQARFSNGNDFVICRKDFLDTGDVSFCRIISGMRVNATDTVGMVGLYKGVDQFVFLGF